MALYFQGWGPYFIGWGSAASPASVASPPQGNAGWFYYAPRVSRKRLRDEIEKKLRGEVPAPAAQAIANVVVQQVVEPADDLEERLESALLRRHVAMRARYMTLLRQQIERIRARDDEEIVLALLIH